MEISITSTPDEKQIRVVSPYSEDFVGRARGLRGRWSSPDKAWVFDARAEPIVRSILVEIYGTDDTKSDAADLVAVFVYARHTVTQPCGPIAMDCGITLARAIGRDSGARVADSVAHLRGPKPGSGGSRANWITTLPAGCLLICYDVPRALAERALLETDYLCRIGEGTEMPDAVIAQMMEAIQKSRNPSAP